MKRGVDRVDGSGRARPTVWGWALWTAAMAVGAAACFGDIIIEKGKPLETETDPVVPTDTACVSGKVQCEGQWLEVCDDRTGSGPEWNKIQDCLSPTLCLEDPGGCEPPECRAGQPRCSGAVPETCTASLDGYDALAECVNAAHCSPDEAKCGAEGKVTPCCLETPCDAGELRCNGSEMQRCRADQTDLDLVATCATFELCEVSRPDCDATSEQCECQPPVCQPGETRCTESSLERCNAGQTDWEPVQDCVTRELCELSRSRVPLSCAPVPCAPGEFNCDGANLEQCNAGQTGFALVMPCTGGPGFCNEALGMCSQCEVGDTRCDGAQIQTCRGDRSGFDPVLGSVCATPQLCGLDSGGDALCSPPECEDNEFQCVGNQLERCNDGRTDFEPFGAPCARPDLCSGTRARCDFCVPSRRECTPDRTASRTCDASGNAFGPLTPCPLGCIPETGACQTCTEGTYTCSAGQLSRCDDGFSFTPLNRGADCSGASAVTCTGNRLQTSPCGAVGCNTTRNTCNECSAAVQGSCAAGLSCTPAGLCRCTQNAFGCIVDSLVRCNAAGTSTAPAARCGGGNNNVLRTCDDGELTEDPCASGQLCSVSAGDTCAVCVPNQLSCATGVLTLCNGAGTAAAPAADCAGSILRACVGTQLETDDCGTAELCNASNGSVCAVCLDTEPPICLDEVTEVRCIAGERVELECTPGDTCVGNGCETPVTE